MIGNTRLELESAKRVLGWSPDKSMGRTREIKCQAQLSARAPLSSTVRRHHMTDINPYEPPRSSIRDPSRLGVGWKKALAVWWSVSWRGGLYVAVGGLLLGALGGVFAVITGAPEKGALYGAVGGYMAMIPASVLGMKQGLSRHLSSLIAIHTRDVA